MEPTNNPQPSVNPEAGAVPAEPVTSAPEVAAPTAVAPETAAPVAVPETPAATSVVAPEATAAMPTAAPEAPIVAPAPPTIAPAPEAAAMPDLAAAASDLAAAAPDLAAGAVGVAAPTAVPVDATAVAGGAPEMGGLASPTPPSPSLNGLPLTEPIMRPDLPPAPDPIKQELEAPMKAAGPVPGSIGSTISVSQDGTQLDANGQPLPANSGQGAVANVAFNDPAKQPEGGQPADANAAKKKSKAIKFDLKNMNRATLVTLIVVAAMIVIGLVTVLIMQLMA